MASPNAIIRNVVSCLFLVFLGHGVSGAEAKEYGDAAAKRSVCVLVIFFSVPGNAGEFGVTVHEAFRLLCCGAALEKSAALSESGHAQS